MTSWNAMLREQSRPHCTLLFCLYVHVRPSAGRKTKEKYSELRYGYLFLIKHTLSLQFFFFFVLFWFFFCCCFSKNTVVTIFFVNVIAIKLYIFKIVKLSYNVRQRLKKLYRFTLNYVMLLCYSYICCHTLDKKEIC